MTKSCEDATRVSEKTKSSKITQNKHMQNDPTLNHLQNFGFEDTMKDSNEKSSGICDFSASHSLETVSFLKDMTNKEWFVKEKFDQNLINVDEIFGQNKTSKCYQKNSLIEKIVDDIPGLAKRDYLDWLEPRQTNFNVNVLDILPQKQSKITSTSNSIVDSASNISFQAGKMKTIQFSNSTKPQIDRTTSAVICKNGLSSTFNNNDLSYSGSFSKNDEVISNFFNLNVNISSDKNSKTDGTTEIYRTHVLRKEESNTRIDVLPQEKNTNKDDITQCDLKKEDNEFCSFAKEDVSQSSIFSDSSSKPIMNLTNFYNDAKNQIDDSECDSSSYDLSENSQYESVTVLKSEPIIDNNVLNNLNGNVVDSKHLSNLDDAIFVFQNNLEPIETMNTSFNTKKVSAPKQNEAPALDCKSTSTMTNGNNVKNICDQKLGSNVKLRNIKCMGLSLSSQSLVNSRSTSVTSNELDVNENVKSNGDDILCGVSNFVSGNQNKTQNNKINVKYFSIASDNSISLNNSLKPDLKNNYLMKAKLPVHHTKANSNVKYLVKDKNIFKLVYVKAPQTDVSGNNIQIFNPQQRKPIKEKRMHANVPQSYAKKTNTIFESSSSVNLPKLVHFETIPNKTFSLNDVSKTKKTISTENSDQKQDVPPKAVNIIYHPSKHPIIVGPKNLIVSLPPAKGNKIISNTDVQKQVLSYSTEKEVDQKTTKQYNSANKKDQAASTNDSDQAPAICSTAMEQVREFESILEKVTKTSQLKEKVSPVEDIDDNSYSTNQVSSKNITAVTLGNILLQPAKLATYTNLIYTSESKKTGIEKTPSLKQTIVSNKAENKVVKPVTSSFQAPAVSNNPSSNSTKPTQKTQEDEKTTEKIYKILHSYSEKIKNAPELKNKPAPRRRSNPPMNASSKCKKNLKCTGKIMFESNSSLDSNREFETTHKEVITTVFPKITGQSKEINTNNPLQIRHLTVPPSMAQDNQVMFVTNDKHLILKKIKNVQKIWTKNPPIMKPILKVDPNIQSTQVIQYKIKNNNSGNGLSFINYVPSCNKATNIHSLATFSPVTTAHSGSYQGQVCKLAQETQTDVTMQHSTVPRSALNEVKLETKTLKSCVNKWSEIERKQVLDQNNHKVSCGQSHFYINIDKYYLKNIDVLFFTSLIFLNHPSSQLFMFEAINALNRMMQTNQSLVSNSTSKHFSIEQIHKLGSSFWQKFRIVYDIMLKKKGPHITDTMIMVVEKADNKAINDKLQKLNNYSEDKIKVNKCNKNPKCYGKKNGDNSSSNKNFKFPHPLEPTVIITNKSETLDDTDVVRNDSFRKVPKSGRKRTYSKIRTVNFDEIEVDNPKNYIPKKKKKCNKVVSSNTHNDILKNKDLNNGESINLSERRKQNNNVRLNSRKNLNSVESISDRSSNRKVFNRIGNNKQKLIDSSLMNGENKIEKRKLEKDSKTHFSFNTMQKMHLNEASSSNTSLEMINQNINTTVANTRTMRRVIGIQAIKKQKLN